MSVLSALIVACLCMAAAGHARGQPDKPSGTLDPGAAMQFHVAGNGGNCSGCEWIAAEGVITADTPAAFQAFLRDDYNPRHLRFHSGGGDLLAGLELGRLIRQEGIATSVGRTEFRAVGDIFDEDIEPAGCAGACAYAFLGGVDRYGGGGTLGFHQFDRTTEADERVQRFAEETGLSADQLIQGMLVAYVIEMGVDARIVTAASTRPGPDAQMPSDAGLSEAELNDLNVLTRPYDDSEWWLEPWGNGAMAMVKRTYPDGSRNHLGVYCRRDDAQVYLLMSIALASESADLNSLLTSMGDVSLYIDDEEFPVAQQDHANGPEGVTVSSSADTTFITTWIPPTLADRLAGADTLGISFGFPHVFWGYNDFHNAIPATITPRDRTMLVYALRSCV